MGTEPERPAAAEPAPAAFHYGPGHMIMHGNAVFVTMFGRGVVGQPAREAMIGLPPRPSSSWTSCTPPASPVPAA